ncbi:hypothetical protein B0I35DRAFT_440426 [Stachybotrys elegans]|uniref:Poly A polymerase head domain-containing protein n=1 Tax=Stachybotrys elegans TaxID=80388 RepID=A0A8K0SJ94_9HYPO|nr:hypothetical protein B0I35DRAFT_440426 [Stachybotrys elegans]
MLCFRCITFARLIQRLQTRPYHARAKAHDNRPMTVRRRDEQSEPQRTPKRMKFSGAQNAQITLLPAEKLLRDLLLDCRNELDDPSSLGMWITGGWVRDRLLGIPCSDVDIALSSMTGVQFGNALTSFLEKNGQSYLDRANQLGLPKSKFSGFNTTKKNLDKSKKLETAVGRLFGLDLDLVNLRKEVYEEDSRTPEMEFGTPEEDAFRRDATVNSMFYDLIEEKVVDLTGKGLEDLSARIMRTPLEPRQTFLDDPLRVLRLIRIGSKLGYDIDPGVTDSMAQDEIHKALNDKVSRERVGIEVFKMMKGKNTHVAFEVLYKTNLYETVFLGLDSGIRKKLDQLPSDSPWPKPWIKAVRTISGMADTQFAMLKDIVAAEDTREQLWTMVAYCPLAKLEMDMKQRKEMIPQIQDALRLTKVLAKLLDTAHANYEYCRALVRDTEADEAPTRSSVGMKIRKMGADWRMQLMFAATGEIVYDPQAQPGSPEILQKYESFLQTAKRLHLLDVVSVRPIINGTTIIKLLGSKGGPWLAGAMEKLVAWQLDHTEAGEEEAKAWLVENREMLLAHPA